MQSVCSVGTTALVDEDDGQKEGSFDRVIGLVYCGNDNINNEKSLNELLPEGRYASIYQEFCGISEFFSAVWAQSWVLTDSIHPPSGSSIEKYRSLETPTFELDVYSA